MKKIKEGTNIIKILSNDSRREIIILLNKKNKDLCVNDISRSLGISQSLTSHQLSYLESRDIISGERTGQTICYRLNSNEVVNKLLKIIKIID